MSQENPVIEAMARVVVAARRSCRAFGEAGVVGAEVMVPLQEALITMDQIATDAALEEYIASHPLKGAGT